MKRSKTPSVTSVACAVAQGVTRVLVATGFVVSLIDEAYERIDDILYSTQLVTSFSFSMMTAILQSADHGQEK